MSTTPRIIEVPAVGLEIFDSVCEGTRIAHLVLSEEEKMCPDGTVRKVQTVSVTSIPIKPAEIEPGLWGPDYSNTVERTYRADETVRAVRGLRSLPTDAPAAADDQP